MRFALTALACALVAGFTALTVLGGGSRAGDPGPVQLAGKGRETHSAAAQARAHHARERRDRATGAGRHADVRAAARRASVATSSRASLQASPATYSSAPPSMETSTMTTSGAPTTVMPDDDAEGSDDD
jgi:hypothetical protein